jgi:hypothetical protein
VAHRGLHPGPVLIRQSCPRKDQVFIILLGNL